MNLKNVSIESILPDVTALRQTSSFMSFKDVYMIIRYPFS